MKITIVTVTYSEEFPLLLVQARSIVKYFVLQDLEEVVWIINSERNDHFNKDFIAQATNLLQSANIRLRVLYRDEYKISEKFKKSSGWKHQQTLKILVSQSINTSHYLLLDTKNHFTRQVSSSILFRENKAITFKYRCSEALKPYLCGSAASLGHNVDSYSWVMPTATPYLMHTSATLDLIKYIKIPFDEFFYSDHHITEFFLYFSYLSKLGILEELYSFVPQFYATFFASYPTTDQQIEHIKSLVSSKDVFCVGVHRDRFKSCTPEFKSYLSDLWMNHDLIENDTDFNLIFDALAVDAP